MNKKTVWNLIATTFRHCRKDKVSHLSAALSFYTVFSLVPVLVICISMAGFIFGKDVVTAHVLTQIGNSLGKDTSIEIKLLVENVSKPSSNIIASILGGITLVWGALGLFSEIQNSFNVIWKIKPQPRGSLLVILKNRFLSFSIVVGMSFLLLVSLVFSAFLTALSEQLHNLMPTEITFWLLLDFIISTGAITFLFAVIFKIVPDVILKWKDVFLGAFLTALLFTLGKSALSMYLAKSNISTTYGAAASLIVILVWAYFSAQILLLGAEFVKVYTDKYDTNVKPKKMAEDLPPDQPSVS